jgi:hypothetical protein
MFTIENVTNLVWINAEKTIFKCDVKYAEFNEVHPTGVDNVDQYAHIKELWEKGNAGVYGQIADYVEPVYDDVQPTQPQPNTTGSQTL